ncbi:phosphoribosylglycinamide formyltransferase [Pantoea sp. Aalb]|uniref:phosphoribosylglycinamide formyltransferase n=1 Tax=Pantoea sp. Aalb TaxID=2576762 RepID=UPI001322A492|nr:phosphoribosylglycinamide formyltransferase [Pantoea sp. Aalb]MXP67265.1 phosphoribosylglycinamide formyltransferase [Pantoea sp. Aalb]
MKKLVVLISGNGSNLQSIIDACANKYINANVVAVFSDKPKAYGLIRAQNANIPIHVLSDKNFVNREIFDSHLIQKIELYTPDLIILAGYMKILSDFFIIKYHKKIINIHPSLLPKYPGLYTHRQVLKNRDKEHGTTVHFVNNKLDGGPIILQSTIPVFIEDTEKEIIKRVKYQEHIIYPLAIRWFIEDRLEIRKNVVTLDGLILPSQGLLYNK